MRYAKCFAFLLRIYSNPTIHLLAFALIGHKEVLSKSCWLRSSLKIFSHFNGSCRSLNNVLGIMTYSIIMSWLFRWWIIFMIFSSFLVVVLISSVTVTRSPCRSRSNAMIFSWNTLAITLIVFSVNNPHRFLAALESIVSSLIDGLIEDWSTKGKSNSTGQKKS